MLTLAALVACSADAPTPAPDTDALIERLDTLEAAHLDALVRLAELEHAERRLTELETTCATQGWVAEQAYATRTWVTDQAYATQLQVVPELTQYVTVNPATHDVVFTGANIHVRSGSGATDDHGAPVGLGNFIVGYAEDDHGAYRTGSHNIALGSSNDWTSTGGIVSGFRNGVHAADAAAIAGRDNAVDAGSAVALAGDGNHVDGLYAAVIASSGSAASGMNAVVLSGVDNEASAYGAVALGGLFGIASGDHAVGVGGVENAASGMAAVTAGGSHNRAVSTYSAVFGTSSQTTTSQYQVLP